MLLLRRRLLWTRSLLDVQAELLLRLVPVDGTSGHVSQSTRSPVLFPVDEVARRALLAGAEEGPARYIVSLLYGG